MDDPHFSKGAAQAAFLDSVAKSFNSPDAAPDLLIICDGQQYLCHRSVLTRQSEWFRKALNGPFTESKAHTIELHDDDKHAVGAMLQYCYAFDYDQHSQAIFHVRVIALAEKYFVQGLAQLAADRFLAAGTDSTALPEDITKAITEAHTTVYDKDSMLRIAIARLVMLKADIFLNGKCAQFDALMDKHPSLAADVARALAKTWKAQSPDLPEAPPWDRTYHCPDLCGDEFQGNPYRTGRMVHLCFTTKKVHDRTSNDWHNYCKGTEYGRY